MLRALIFALPPLLIGLLALQLASAEKGPGNELLGLGTDRAVGVALATTKLEGDKSLLELKKNITLADCDQREKDFRKAYNSSIENQTGLGREYEEAQKRAKDNYESKVAKLKNMSAQQTRNKRQEQVVEQVVQVTLLEHVWQLLEKDYPYYCKLAINFCNWCKEKLREGYAMLVKYLIHFVSLPTPLLWVSIFMMLAPLLWIFVVAPRELNELLAQTGPLPFDLTQSPRQPHLPLNPDSDESDPKPVSKLNPNAKPFEPSINRQSNPTVIPDRPLRMLRVSNNFGDIPSEEHTVNDPVLTTFSPPAPAQISPPPTPPKPSPEELQQQKEKEETGDKALDEWFDTYRVEQIHALENARTIIAPSETVLRTSQPPQPQQPRQSNATSVPPPNYFPQTIEANLPGKTQPPLPTTVDDSPTLTIPIRAAPTPDQEDDPAAPQEPDTVSDDELMEELMEDTPRPRSIPKPQFGSHSPQIAPKLQSPGQLPRYQQDSPQFQQNSPQYQHNSPQFHNDSPQFQPTRLQSNLRTESEPVLRNQNPSVFMTPNPNPAVSPDSLADSRSLRKTLRARPYLEPEEPEPQPVSNTSPVISRSRSTSVTSSVESESQQVSRIRTDRGIRGSSSPTPHVREAFYRRELGNSQDDSASKPKRELEQSDHFESEIDAESMPGSDSERDSDVE